MRPASAAPRCAPAGPAMLPSTGRARSPHTLSPPRPARTLLFSMPAPRLLVLQRQPAPELPYVRQRLHRPHGLDQLFRPAGTDNRNEQIAAFGGDLFTAHGIGGRTEYRFRVVPHAPAVVHGDFHGRLRRPGAPQRRAALELDAFTHPQNFGIFYARLVVSRREGDVTVDQHHGYEMLDIDTRHPALIERARALIVDGHGHVLHVQSLDTVPPDQIGDGIERGLNRVADGPALDRRVLDLVHAPEIGDQLCRLDELTEGLKKPALAFECVIHAGETHVRHQRSGDTVAGRHAAEMESLLHVLDVTRPARKTRCLLG